MITKMHDGMLVAGQEAPAHRIKLYPLVCLKQQNLLPAGYARFGTIVQRIL